MAVLRESPWYQEILQEGIALGEERGIALGEERGIALGEERGIALGEERGIALGEERGIALGEERSLRRVALQLLRQGMSVEFAAEVTGLSRDRISQLQSEQ